MAGRRHKIAPRKSKQMFSKHASSVHKKNLPKTTRVPMRGGIRM